MEKNQKGITSEASEEMALPESHKPPIDMDEPLRWANEHVTASSSVQCTQRPWATTWRLKTSQGDVWLKQLAPVLSESINASVHLAEKFPDTVPGVISADD